MQPILAESAPHRGRAVALAVALTFVASLSLLLAQSSRPSKHRWNHQRSFSKCPHATYVYLVRE